MQLSFTPHLETLNCGAHYGCITTTNNKEPHTAIISSHTDMSLSGWIKSPKGMSYTYLPTLIINVYVYGVCVCAVCVRECVCVCVCMCVLEALSSCFDLYQFPALPFYIVSSQVCVHVCYLACLLKVLAWHGDKSEHECNAACHW